MASSAWKREYLQPVLGKQHVEHLARIDELYQQILENQSAFGIGVLRVKNEDGIELEGGLNIIEYNGEDEE